MSPELETLDQLLGGDMALAAIRTLYPNNAAFLHGILGLLSCGDGRLLASDGKDVARWRWRELFARSTVAGELDNLKLHITEQGARKIK